MPSSHLTIWIIAAATTTGVLVRPFGLSEAVWAVTGGVFLVLLGLLSPAEAVVAIGKGGDVYLFLIGMMLLAETARREGVFDWVAGHAVSLARGSRSRLFTLIYAAGVLITTVLSNDATAVVLTPAVLAATKKAKVPALPYLFICAFTANAASFVLPISNPANLVMYGERIPSLVSWLRSFALPSLLAIAASFAALWFTQRAQLQGTCASSVPNEALSAGGRTALAALGVTTLILTAASAMDMQLGLPTCVMGFLSAAAISLRSRASLLTPLREISWTVLPLVAGLFMLVEAVNKTGAIVIAAQWLTTGVHMSMPGTAAGAGALLAFGSNIVNNLPAGLLATTAIAQAQPPQAVVDSMLIGIDLGPNLSVTGSLATILWLTAIRREGNDVSFMHFLKVGVIVMPPALALAIAARLLAS